ncbi:hypothetical protein BDV25DRAFT_163539 [Aspergillus avenaceus]|uniref:Uncharacterized protein n=1 Tax=Aspergillus avenaceus TaxID=36643 RepID=A0A5N6TIJ9_ASPAV|nr:hypothetical protein BDV25DRAFT_163539 [Aspergillus avenaceus]
MFSIFMNFFSALIFSRGRPLQQFFFFFEFQVPERSHFKVHQLNTLNASSIQCGSSISFLIFFSIGFLLGSRADIQHYMLLKVCVPCSRFGVSLAPSVSSATLTCQHI